MDSSPPFRTVLTRASVLPRPVVDGGELQPELQPHSQRPASPALPGSTGIAASSPTWPPGPCARVIPAGSAHSLVPIARRAHTSASAPATFAPAPGTWPATASASHPLPRGIHHQRYGPSRLGGAAKATYGSTARGAGATDPAIGLTPAHSRCERTVARGIALGVMVVPGATTWRRGRTGQARMASAAKPTPTRSRALAGRAECGSPAVLHRPAPETGSATAQVQRRSCGTSDRA